MVIRPPYVAGQFYPGKKEQLLEFLSGSLRSPKSRISPKAILVPHAGYVYSGETAAKTYAQIEIPGTALLIGPNHTGLGRSLSLMAQGLWQTPLGTVPIDAELGRRLLANPVFEQDEEAHCYEHALEVQLPFLQYLRSDVRIVPLVVGTLDLKKLKEAGQGMARALQEYPEDVLIVISSDLNHYEDEKTTREKDQDALAALLQLNPESLADVIRRKDISMCGFGPAYLALSAFKELGVRQAVLVDHTTSARQSGDFDRVVGYAGVIFK